jgi:hypothetical protein
MVTLYFNGKYTNQIINQFGEDPIGIDGGMTAEKDHGYSGA